MVRSMKKISALTLALVMILSLVSINVSADANHYLYFNPSTASGSVGNIVSVKLYTNTALNVAGFEARVHYDPTAFYIDTEDNDFDGYPDGIGLDTAAAFKDLFTVNINNTDGVVFVGGLKVGGGAWTQTVVRILCTLNFTVKPTAVNGDHSLTYGYIEFASAAGEPIPLGTHQFGNITTSGGVDPEPSGPVDPTVTWPTVSAITYGQTFADAISGGSANCPGTFAIADAATVPNAGTYTGKTVTFTPADLEAFNVMTTTVDVTVNKADQAAPSLTASSTKNSVTIDPVAGAVYGLRLSSSAAAVSYGASNVFSGLRPSTEYTAFIKLPATTNFNESPEALLDVTTAAKPAPADRTFDKMNLSKPGSIDIKGPSDVAVDSTGSIIVADSMNSRILKYDQTGALLATYGELGAGVGQFNTPVGLVVGADDSIYVADTYNSRIVKFKDANTNGIIEAGEWTAWGTYGNGVKEFKKPAGLFVAGTKVYVADTYNHRIAIFDTVDGDFWAAYGSKGTGDSNFFYPMDVAVDAYGDIWVADVYNNAVKQLNAAGEFVSSYAAALPYGVAIDADGNVYASLRTAGKIICVNSPKEFGGKGTLANQFINPTGITFDSEGNLWVVDVSTNTVKKALGI